MLSKLKVRTLKKNCMNPVKNLYFLGRTIYKKSCIKFSSLIVQNKFYEKKTRKY